MTLKPEVLAAMDSIDGSESVNATPHPDCSYQVKLIDLDDWSLLRAELLAMDAEISQLKAAYSGAVLHALENGQAAQLSEESLDGVDIYNPSSTLKPIAGYVVLVDGSLLKTIHPTLEAAKERAMLCYADKHLISIATIGGPTTLA